MLPRIAAVVLLSIAASMSLAQGHRWGVSASAMFGQDWLGSEDTRRGGLYAVSLSHREPRLHFLGYDADMEVEAYYMFTKGGSDFVAGPNSSHHYGALFVGRYFQKYAKSARAFVEAGWGLQYTNRLTHDLDSLWNSTPMVGTGIIVPFEKTDLMISVRYFHISNAGTAGGNEGLNFIQLRFGLRF